MAGTPKPIGRILIIPKGSYDPSTPYNSLDLVRYDSKSWLCKTDGIIGITPTEGTDWTLMTEDGTDGRGIVNIQLTGTDPSNPLKDIYTITYTDGTTSTFTVTNGTGGGGSVSGDMTKSEYAPSGVHGKVDHAINADNVGNADTSLLEKLSDNSGKLNYNGNALMLEMAQLANQAKLGEFVVNQIGNNVKELALHSDITTKLSKVDTTDNLSVELAKKINKPASATNGQVLTYNGTSNEWEAQDSKGGDLSDVYGTSDLWSSKTSWAKDEICIDENKLWKCLISNSNKPTEGTEWTQISLATLKQDIDNKLKWISVNDITDVPSDANEISIAFSAYGTSFEHVYPNDYVTGEKWYSLGGYYANSSSYASCSIMINRDTGNIGAMNFVINGTDCYNAYTKSYKYR